MCGLNKIEGTSFIVDDDLVAIDLAVVGVLVGGHEVVLVVKLDKTVPSGLFILTADDADGLDDTVLLGGERDTSNSYLSVFSVVL